MTAEEKLIQLARASVPLQSFFGTPLFRWFAIELQPGYIDNGSCATLNDISAFFLYSHDGLNGMAAPRIQIDIFDLDAIRLGNAMAAVMAFMKTVNLASNDQFGSPTVTPRQFPCFLLNRRSGQEFRTKQRVFKKTLDYRVYNLEE